MLSKRRDNGRVELRQQKVGHNYRSDQYRNVADAVKSIRKLRGPTRRQHGHVEQVIGEPKSKQKQTKKKTRAHTHTQAKIARETLSDTHKCTSDVRLDSDADFVLGPWTLAVPTDADTDGVTYPKKPNAFLVSNANTLDETAIDKPIDSQTLLSKGNTIDRNEPMRRIAGGA